MASPLVLERPGRWGVLGVTVLLLCLGAPGIPLLWKALTSFGEATTLVDKSFVTALINSCIVALLVSVVAFLLGLPGGVCIALYDIPGRKVFLALLALPLLVPSFLWAIGWSALTGRFGLGTQAASGLGGCVLVFSGPTIALTLLASYAATRTLSASQVDSARLAGGERAVLLHTSRHAVIPALLAAALGGVLTLQDPGPGLIFGLRTAASEIRTGFNAFFDFGLVGRQCVVLTSLVLLVAVPLAWFTAPRIASQVLARQTRKPCLSRHSRVTTVAVAGLGLITVISVFLPLLGLALPLGRSTQFVRAWNVVVRTGGDTLLYAVGAGLISATLSLLLAILVGRNARLCTFAIAASLVFFSLPSAFTALGIVEVAASAPEWADPFLRSSLTVCAGLGLRFLPVAAVISLRAWGSTSPSWTMVATVHGVPLGRYVFKVVVPLLSPAFAVAVIVVALLATADVVTVLLLHPPGGSSLPLAIFTIMANAPESLVASLSLLYVTLAAGVLFVVWTISRRRST